ncbi:glycosyltransferase family 4 protein [Nocardioides sp. GXQ0305]|uniref:glycosyltransferase family 4 protein n=1 Tax=Nocardioides sp. GXQ0305 TaxID=3423912 RepID=UPI003D7C531F
MQRDDFQVRAYPSLDSVGVSSAGGPLRVAIATEEIIGPVRNGGIASTYYHLAKGLANQGHDVEVLFLKGPVVQDETPEHWVDHYASFGVRLHYLDMPTVPIWGAAATWQRRYAAAYEWLRDSEPFDVVHTSEWRGGLVYALMAKRLGLAFRDTLFLVKTSSPYIWNRHYQMQPITHPDLVAAAHAEQKCVELADVVIGGSAHLISFMDQIGYRLPDTNVYVQPNIVDFSNVTVEDRRPGARREPGDLVSTRDLVFFGRLEARKGIQLFCNAVDVLHERGEIPSSITFLGKWGAGLATHGGMSPQDYVAEKAHTWACPVEVVTDRNQAEALSFLCQRDVIAVMPSLIENSTMAVYEALEQRIPFIATSVGGTSELIDEADHEACLVEPTAHALSDRIGRVLREGQRVARPSFSNDDNLRVWYGFHAHVGDLIRERGVASISDRIDAPGSLVETMSFVALVRSGEVTDDLVKALHEEPPDEVVLGYNDSGVRSALELVRDALAESPARITLVNCIGRGAGEALSMLAEVQACDAMTLANGVAALPKVGFFDAARRGLTTRPAALFTTFFATTDDTQGMPLGGDVASQALTSRAYGPEMISLRREAYAEIGDLEPYDTRHGILHEYVTRAASAGHDLLVYPEQLTSWKTALADTRAYQDDPTYAYLKAKSLIDDSQLGQRKVLLAALQRAGASGVDERFLRGATDDPSETHWLMPATWNAEDVAAARNRRLVVGLDADRNELWLYAQGPGDRRFLVRGEAQAVQPISSRGEEDTDEHVTLSTFRVPETWESGTSYPIVWGLYDGEEKIRSLFLRINKISPATLVCAARNPVLSARALQELADRRPVPWPKASDRVDPPQAEREVTEDYVMQAVAAARQFVRQERATDPEQVLRTSRALLFNPPVADLHPISPGSGLKAPHWANGWAIGDWLEGWAWDREHRERTLHVVVARNDEPLLMVAADGKDAGLSHDVPGRGEHAWRIPVLPELLEGDVVQLQIWEGRTPVHRGALYVDHEGEPLLRRVRSHGDDEPDLAGAPRKTRGWWRR